MRVTGYPEQSHACIATPPKSHKIDFSIYEHEQTHHFLSADIEFWMNLHGLTIEQMAELLGIHPLTLKARLYGGVDYRLYELQHYKDLTGSSWNFLLDPSTA